MTKSGTSDLFFIAISYFVQCIRNYGSAVNYNTACSKAIHKYLFKALYNRTNIKEYDLQIRQYSICHTNIIAMKDVIIEKKAREKEGLLEGIANTITPAEVI